MALNIKDLGKMETKKMRRKKKVNNWVILHSYKNYLASLFLDLINLNIFEFW